MATTEPNETEATERNANRQNQTERVSPNSEGSFYFNSIWLLVIHSLCIFIVLSEAGFSQEWTANNEQRSRQRQVEVQANVTNNPNRPTEYRTVTAPQSPPNNANNEQEAEEREFKRHKYLKYDLKIMAKFIDFFQVE